MPNSPPPTKLPTHPNAKNPSLPRRRSKQPPFSAQIEVEEGFFFARIPIIGTHLPTILPASSRDLCQGRKGACLFSSKCGMGYFYFPAYCIIIFFSLFAVNTKTLSIRWRSSAYNRRREKRTFLSGNYLLATVGERKGKRGSILGPTKAVLAPSLQKRRRRPFPWRRSLLLLRAIYVQCSTTFPPQKGKERRKEKNFARESLSWV